jgi:hypothetical protein
LSGKIAAVTVDDRKAVRTTRLDAEDDLLAVR